MYALVVDCAAGSARWFDITGADGAFTYKERLHAAPVAIGAWARFDGVECADSERFLQSAYGESGLDCVNALRGDFSFAVHDSDARTVVAARDPFGQRPLYVYRGHGTFGVATNVGAFRHAGLPLAPDPDWVAAFVVRASMSHTQTAYHEVTKLQGGHRLIAHLDDLDAEGVPSVEAERWHSFVDDAPWADTHDPARVAAYREVLERAVGHRISTDANLGIETSGGIDSSTCLGLAAELWPRTVDDIHTFGYVSNEEEPDFILETSKLHGIENNVIIGPGDPRPNTPHDRMLEVLGYPFEHGNGPSHEAFYVEAERRGVDTLLSGFGGDEAVTLPAVQLDRELMDRRKWRLLWGEMFGPAWQRPLRLVRRIMRHRRGSKEVSALTKAVTARWQYMALRLDVAERHDIERRFLDGSSWDSGYRTINSFVLGNRVLQPFVPTRMENCSLLAAAHGIDYQWPLLDAQLVQQWLSTPAIEKRHRNLGRLLHRRAVAGSVPDKVRLKQSKDMGGSIIGDTDERERRRGVLPESPHPMLDDLVDLERLAEAQRTATDAGAARVVNMQVRNVCVLDTWLMTYHADVVSEPVRV